MASLHQFHERDDAVSNTVPKKIMALQESWRAPENHTSRTLSVILDSKVKMAS